MYKEFTAAYWRAHLKLPDDYSVEGMLIYGAWDEKRFFGLLEASLSRQGVAYQKTDLPDFLDRMMEFVINGKRYWFAVSYGGALLSEYIHLACMFGSQKNIFIGTCGGLNDELRSGDFILPTYVYGNESTTRLYQRDVTDHRHVPDQAFAERLAADIATSFTVHRGPTVTCQAMMGETVQDIRDWSAEGYSGVEMEAATVVAVSNHFSVPSAALLLVGDNLIKGEAVGGEGYENARAFRESAREEQYRVAIKELLS